MVSEVLAWLAPRLDGTVIDATVGAGGHAEAMLEASSLVRIVGLDRDPVAVRMAGARLARFGPRATVKQGNFANLKAEVARDAPDGARAVLVDLGVSDMQLNEPNRGFSFRRMGPLDMRMGPDAEHTAEHLLRHSSERELADIIFKYGEDRNARRIARRIVAARDRTGIGSTTHLADLVASAAGGGGGRDRIHPATRTFQALRITVNRELEALEAVLPQALEVLCAGGRLAVITFHSLEDRPVKHWMALEAKGCLCPPDFPECRCGHRARLVVLTKKAAVPSPDEIERNAGARSAKLRVAEKL